MSLTLKVPTHLDGRNPIVGPYTARELVPVVAGVFGAAGVLAQPHPALVARLGEALAVLVLGLLLGLVRPGGRSLVTWGRLVVTHLLAQRASAWTPPASIATASTAVPGALRPPHLPPGPRSREPGGAGVAPAAPTGPTEQRDHPPPRRPATQSHPFVPVEIADDTIVFADGHRCAVLECSGANIATMDAEQQRALHAAYHAVLLGLTFPLQILVCADPVDLGPYAARRTERLAACPLAVRRLGSADTAYMRRATARLGALDQHVYVVIPAGTSPVPSMPQGADLLPLLRHRSHLTAAQRAGGDGDASTTGEAERRLAERCNAVREGLGRAGVHAWRLDTAALQELSYRRLCPRTARLQPLDHGHVAPLATGHVLFTSAVRSAVGMTSEEDEDA